jgi:hypothetical protein
VSEAVDAPIDVDIFVGRAANIWHKVRFSRMGERLIKSVVKGWF